MKYVARKPQERGQCQRVTSKPSRKTRRLAKKRNYAVDQSSVMESEERDQEGVESVKNVKAAHEV